MLATLTEDMLWQGKLYEKGEREIPDDLAEAMGLKQPEPEPTEKPKRTPKG